MKRDRWILCLIGAVLAFVLSLATVQCMISAFSLEIHHGTSLVLACVAFSVGSALCLQLKFGAVAALGIAAMGALIFLPGCDGLQQETRALVYRLSQCYDSAYGWGVLKMGLDSWNFPSDRPMQLLAYGAAVGVSFVVCRRQPVWLALLPTLVPLLLCMVVTDTVPAPLWLYLMLLGLIVLLMTASLRRKAVGQSNTLTAMVALAAALVLGLLFWGNPRESYVNKTENLQDRLLQWVDSFPTSVEELTEQLPQVPEAEQAETENLRNVGVQYRQTYPVLEVTASVNGPLYLRGQDFDSYTGTSWRSGKNRSEMLEAPGFLQETGAVTVHTRRAREYLLLPYYPRAGTALTEGSAANGEAVQDYSYTQLTLPADWRESVTGTGAPFGGRNSVYRALPQATAEWAGSAAAEAVGDAVTATEKADRIAAFVRSTARYDLETASMPANEADFAHWFFTESDSGYCVHFASLATVLLRAAGVEARYVTGYLTQGVAGQAVTVTAAQAHAWTEYYEPSLGVWIPLEATPGSGELPPEPTDASTETTQTATEATTEVTTEVTADVTTEATVPAESEEPTVSAPEEPEHRREMPKWLRGMLGLLLGAGIFLALAQGQRMLRMELRRKRYARRGINGRALMKWQEVVYYARIFREKPPKEPEALAQKAKFSQHTLTQEELAVFDRQLAAYRRALRAQPVYRRVLLQYLYAVE